MASRPVAGARLEARSPCGAPCSVAAWRVSRKPGVPSRWATSPTWADFLLFGHTFWKTQMSAGREGLDASPRFLAGVPSTCNGDGT